MWDKMGPAHALRCAVAAGPKSRRPAQRTKTLVELTAERKGTHADVHSHVPSMLRGYAVIMLGGCPPLACLGIMLYLVREGHRRRTQAMSPSGVVSVKP